MAVAGQKTTQTCRPKIHQQTESGDTERFQSWEPFQQMIGHDGLRVGFVPHPVEGAEQAETDQQGETKGPQAPCFAGGFSGEPD